ncbi:elongation factor 2 [Fonticula alba]|uniref:Elongation factor 2 n=1 Tax=Fonticula alba TaxID=691883 RepID=A0A058ZC68_FONAL|nr:elongation factor 2 [Fonticula alba]KCV71541.1 elongation factor 2 [Fonticula alba]|eukprot:XP_009494664.1 elongation factor 2 [Fonticula alba]
MRSPGPAVSTHIVLHEDKQYYPSAQSVYGPGVEIVVQEEDTQMLSEPIVKPAAGDTAAPRAGASSLVDDAGLPETHFNKHFLVDMLSMPDMIRNVAVVGHLHHGKTTLVDMLVAQTHDIDLDLRSTTRYTDTHPIERARELSIKASPMSLVLPDLRGKSYAINVLDTPGHVNFYDETAAAIQVSDGALLVIDAVEGVMLGTEKIIRELVQQRITITVMISKIDRLITELRLPPKDAYVKFAHILTQVNQLISHYSGGDDSLRVSPELGNVCFSSGTLGFSFTLESFATVYSDLHGGSIDAAAFAKRLWGNVYYDSATRRFSPKPARFDMPRTFVQFILEPLYKIVTQVVAEDTASLRQTLNEIGVSIKPAHYRMDVGPLLRLIMSLFLGDVSGIVSMLVRHVPSPVRGGPAKSAVLFTGSQDSPVAEAMAQCDPAGMLVMQVVKLYPNADASSFDAFARVLSGTVRVGQNVRVLGEQYSPDYTEDAVVTPVTGLWVYESRYRIPVGQASAGAWILLGGVDASITKTATIVDGSRRFLASLQEDDLHICRPLRHFNHSIVKVAIEPLHPAELPKMLDGLRKISKTYPLSFTRVEESGEHTLFGTGELYLDCIMHDLRQMFAAIEIKVSDPLVTFNETVINVSAIRCTTESLNKKNKLTVIAEPLDEGLAADIEEGRLSSKWSSDDVSKFLQDKYHWDVLAAGNVWAFGPENVGPNLFINDTLPSEVDANRLLSARDHIVQGFQWGAKEGPLCDEPMRNTKFRLQDAILADDPISRNAGQIIPASRRVCYAAFLTATPRLMEPVYLVEIVVPFAARSAIYGLLGERRGHIISELPLPGSTQYLLKAHIPVMDSFGFETDLRVNTQGAAFCLQLFDHWRVVPGNPLDETQNVLPLEVATATQLARDFMIKTRRRKGLSEDASIGKYFDDPETLQIVKEFL